MPRRHTLLAAALLFGACGAFAKDAAPDVAKAPDLKEIRKLPVGLRVTHSPNPVRAKRGGPSGHRFTWTYATSVEAIDRELTVVEFGSFLEVDGTWEFANFTGKPFSAKDFAEWYSCPGARLRQGKPAKDPQNWGGSDELRSVRGVWYFIATDTDGKRYRGEAVIEERGEFGGK